ncbi:MAG: class I SAM-dependent methyltransferase [Pseudomonadota bacterium]
MCGSEDSRLLGLRLNASQGRRPKAAQGIAVTVKQCSSCGLIYSDPLPIPENVADHYGMPPEDYWGTVQDHGPAITAEIETAKRLLKFSPGMTALDIGAGLGRALGDLREAGFTASGIEPSEPFFRRIPDKTNVQLSTLEDATFADDSFDFITFGAVLEHLYDPSAALAKALKWLKPGGIIQAEVPSTDYLIAKLVNVYFRLCGTNYVTNLSPMHPPFHLYEFTLESLARNGALQNFEIAEYFYSAPHVFHLPRILHPPLRWWMIKRNRPLQLTVYLRKKAEC